MWWGFNTIWGGFNTIVYAGDSRNIISGWNAQQDCFRLFAYCETLVLADVGTSWKVGMWLASADRGGKADHYAVLICATEEDRASLNTPNAGTVSDIAICTYPGYFCLLELRIFSKKMWNSNTVLTNETICVPKNCAEIICIPKLRLALHRTWSLGIDDHILIYVFNITKIENDNTYTVSDLHGFCTAWITVRRLHRRSQFAI